jgi:hypothetical protein
LVYKGWVHCREPSPEKRRLMEKIQRIQGGRMEYTGNSLSYTSLAWCLCLQRGYPDGFAVSQIIWLPVCFYNTISEEEHWASNLSLPKLSVDKEFLYLWSIFNIVRCKRSFIFYLNFLTL